MMQGDAPVPLRDSSWKDSRLSCNQQQSRPGTVVSPCTASVVVEYFVTERAIGRAVSFSSHSVEEQKILFKKEMSAALRLCYQGARKLPPVSPLQHTYIPVRYKKSKAKAKSSPSVENFGSFPINLSKYEDSMKKALDVLQTHYSKLRVDGATPAILDGMYSLFLL